MKLKTALKFKICLKIEKLSTSNNSVSVYILRPFFHYFTSIFTSLPFFSFTHLVLDQKPFPIAPRGTESTLQQHLKQHIKKITTLSKKLSTPFDPSPTSSQLFSTYHPRSLHCLYCVPWLPRSPCNEVFDTHLTKTYLFFIPFCTTKAVNWGTKSTEKFGA